MRRMAGFVAAMVAGAGVCMGQGVAGSRPATSQAAATRKAPFTISKETTAITGPLRTDGTVDYVAALNARYGAGVTPENNGFVVWLKVVGTGSEVIDPKVQREFLRLCGTVETPTGVEVWETYQSYLKRTNGLSDDAASKANDEWRVAFGGIWRANEHQNADAFIKAREKLLATAVQAVGRSKWWVPSVASDGRTMVTVMLPSLSPTRDVANALCARASLRAGSGDVNGFVADIWAARRLARSVGSGPTLIERLVGVGIEAYATKTVAAVAASGVLTESQCKFVMSSLEGFPSMPLMVECVDNLERWHSLDITMQIATGHADLVPLPTESVQENAPTVATPFATIDRAAVDWDAVLRQIGGVFDGHVNAMRGKSLAETKAATKSMDQILAKSKSEAVANSNGKDLSKKAGEPREAYSKRVAESIMAVWMPSFGRAEELSRACAQQSQMVRVVLAAAQVRGKTGKWPATQEELVPGVLKELPKDMYSENEAAPFKYVVTEHGVRVYSVGENGRDDGGVMDRPSGKDDLAVGVRN